MLAPALLCAALLLLTSSEVTEARALQPPPDAVQFLEQFLDRYNQLLTLDDLENLLNAPPESEQAASDAKDGESVPPESPWLRLLRGVAANPKRAEPERSRRGWNRGCFGLKLDRIGSMSGLGC
ncbi:C-type natriuretic peptide-like [Neosynchiropus ocellatus]